MRREGAGLIDIVVLTHWEPYVKNRMGTNRMGTDPLLRGEINCRLAMFIAEFVLAYGVLSPVGMVAYSKRLLHANVFPEPNLSTILDFL